MPSSIQIDAMLPPDPPRVSDRDFNPATHVPEDDIEMETEEGESRAELSSVEINILIYLYLLESNFPHTAFTLLSESNLPETSLFQHFNPSFPTPSGSSRKATTPGLSNGHKDAVDTSFGKAEGRIPRGELIRKLWKGVRWEEVERHVNSSGELNKPGCPNPFHLLIPHTCPPTLPSSQGNPPASSSSLRASPPPSKRPEVFPPAPEERVPGPSRRVARSNNEAASFPSRGKRKSRRGSDASTSRNPSPGRPGVPSRTKKSMKYEIMDREEKRSKRAENSDSEKSSKSRKGNKDNYDSMDVDDDEPKRNKNKKKAASSRLSVKDKVDRRSRSPMKPHEDETEEENEELEELEDKDDAAKQARDEQDAIERERQQLPTWIQEEDVSILNREHSGPVCCIMWNPKNRDVLATTSHDGTARLWELESRTPDGGALEVKGEPKTIKHASIESNKKAVWSLDWHPEGTVFATGSQDGTGRMFTPSGSIQSIMAYGRESISALKFSPSGAQILVGKINSTVTLWTVTNHYNSNMTRLFSSHTQQVNDVDWLDENVFASCGNDRKIFVHRANDRIPRYTFGGGHTDDITKIAWQPVTANKLTEDRLLASACDDGTVRLWAMNRYPKDRGSNNGSTSNGSPSKRDPDSASEDEEDDGDDDEPDFLKDGSGRETSAKKGSSKCVRVLVVVGDSESENKRVNTVAWNREGTMIASGGADHTIKLFDISTGDCVHVLKGLEDGTGSIAFSPVGRGLVAGGGWDGRLVVWSTETGEIVAEWEFDEDRNKQVARQLPMMLSISWRGDGKQLAVGMHNKQVLVVHTGKLIEASGETDETKVAQAGEGEEAK